MAITRTQIAKQLLANGGRTGFQGGGADMGTKAGDKRAARDNREIGARMDRTRSLSKDQIQRARDFRDTQKVKQAFTKKTLFDKIPSSAKILGKIFPGNINYRKEFALSNPDLLDYINSLTEEEQKSGKLMSALNEIGYGDFLAEEKGSPGLKFSGNVGGLEKFVKTRNPDGSPATFGYRNVSDRGDPSILLPQGIMAQAPSITEQEPELEEEDEGLRLAFRANGGRIGFFSAGLARGDEISPGTASSSSRDGPTRRDDGPKGPTGSGGDKGPKFDIFNPIDSMKAIQRFKLGLKPEDITIAKKIEEENEEDVNYPTGGIFLDPKLDEKKKAEIFQEFKADGGRAGLAEGGMPYEGGIMDLESARQMYGLGKLVKKVTRSVKKIAKSPIGKAALTAAAIKFGGGFLKGKGIMSSLFGSPALAGSGRDFFMGMGGKSAATKGLFGTLGLTKGAGSLMPTAFGAITAASALAGLLTPAQEEEAQELARGEGIDIEAARRSVLNAGTSQDFRALAFRAEGGPAEGKEPVAKKTMPLLDMGGKEMDLRAEGGFVPIGRMEKADDVPARLSKNEFVFTADAVRNAGDGDVDKGAEVMYNMMKNLESGGDVSEESQGLKGARRMFQTSQRLEEVL
jgi:hypothetical protein